MGYGDVGFNGHPTTKTPNIDKLAFNGKILSSWYSGCPVCSGSRAALMTGRQYTRIGVPGVFGPTGDTGLPLNETTAADLAKQAGYATGICGKCKNGGGTTIGGTTTGGTTTGGTSSSSTTTGGSGQTGTTSGTQNGGSSGSGSSFERGRRNRNVNLQCFQYINSTSTTGTTDLVASTNPMANQVARPSFKKNTLDCAIATAVLILYLFYPSC